MDLAEISSEMVEISPDLKNFAGKCSISRFGQVSLGFREKTRQSTCRFRVLEAETCRRSSPASSWPILGLDQTGWTSGSGLGFCWTLLEWSCSLSLQSSLLPNFVRKLIMLSLKNFRMVTNIF